MSRTYLLAGVVLGSVLAAVVVRQLLGHGPPIWVLLSAGAAGSVLVGALTVTQAQAVVTGAAPVLLFLFGLFVFASALERAGALEHLARWLVSRARRPADLPAVLFVGFGLLSAFLVNDALVVIGVPVLLAVARRTQVPPRPLLLTLAFSVTVGSVFTPFGNPQNLLISLNSGLATPTATFLRYLLLPTLINLGVGAWYLRRVFRPELATRTSPAEPSVAPSLFPSGGWGGRLLRSPVLWIFPGTMLVLLTFDLLAAATGGPSVPAWEIASLGALLLLLVTPGRAHVLRQVNWQVLVLFAGLFVVVGGAVHGGVVAGAERFLPLPGPSDPRGGVVAITLTALAGSQLVSNVPFVALQIPVLSAAGYASSTPVAWMALAGASTLAGNVTLLGAASNLIVADLAERGGVPIRLGTFVRTGLPLAAISTAVLLAALLLGI